MLRTLLLVSVVMGLPLQSFEPARLQNGLVEPVELMTAAAGMVLMELSVDQRGVVRNTRAIRDVAPFTALVQNSVGGWRFDPARVNGVSHDSKVLVIGLFRPPAMLFPVPEVPSAPRADDDVEIPFPTEIAVPPYPPNNVGSVNVLVEVEVRADGSVGSTRVLDPRERLRRFRDEHGQAMAFPSRRD